LWHSVNLNLSVAFLLIVGIGLYGMARKRTWAPVPFLLLFASQAIAGFYILAVRRHWTVALFILLAIFSLYKTVDNADIYKAIRKNKGKKVVEKKIEVKEPAKKASSTKVAKKTVAKKPVKKVPTKKVTKKKTKK